MRRLLSATATLVALSFAIHAAAQGLATPADEEALVAKARKTHESVITIDTHDDIDTRNFTAEKNYTQDLPTQVNLPKMERGGLDAVFFVVYTGQGELNEAGYAKAYADAIAKFDAIDRLTKEYAPDKIELARNSDDVRRIHKAGKKIALIGVENGYPIGADLGRIRQFAERGALYLSFAHNGHSQLADSNTGERDGVWLHNGLSELGKKAVHEANKWGLVIDLSHPSKQANIQAIKLSQAPVFASHSGARALSDNSRNLDDEELELIKENGGLVQAVAFRSYVNQEKNAARSRASEEVLREYAEKENFKLLPGFGLGGPGGPGGLGRKPEPKPDLSDDEIMDYIANLRAFRAKLQPVIDQRLKDVPDVDVKDFVDHIDYLVKKLGVDHVGISSDFDGGGGVQGWDDASETFNVTLELARRGYTEEQIEKLWGGNLLRTLDKVQEVARRIQKEEGVN